MPAVCPIVPHEGMALLPTYNGNTNTHQETRSSATSLCKNKNIKRCSVSGKAFCSRPDSFFYS